MQITRLKYVLLGFLSLTLNLSYSQNTLDSTRLAILGDASLDLEEIRQIDSLIIDAIEYYNSKVSRGYNQISLSDVEYGHFLHLDSIRNEISPFIKKNGKVDKRKLNKINTERRVHIDSLLQLRFEVNNELSDLQITGKPNREDSVISSWGSAEIINLDTYYRQYQVFSDSSGKSVLIHCFCEDILNVLSRNQVADDSIWKTNLFTVNDGGVCFFKMLIHVEKLERNHVMMNGIR